MADFKTALILLVAFCLVSNGVGISLAGRNVDENSAVARFFRGLDKREERVGRAECEDSMDVFYCFYTAVEEESCGTNGHQCAYTCGLC